MLDLLFSKLFEKYQKRSAISNNLSIGVTTNYIIKIRTPLYRKMLVDMKLTNYNVVNGDWNS